jgi:hypothetical protein
MKSKIIYNYISLSLILVIFIVILLYKTDSIEYFENATTTLFETRLVDAEKKYDKLMTDVNNINNSITKYDKMYAWYETKLEADQVAAKKSSAEAQAILKNAKSNDTTTASKITDTLIKGAKSTGDEDNMKSVANAIVANSPPL